MSNLKLYSVNWQDGMLLNEQHLKEQEKFFQDLARWYAMPTGDSYGLMRKGKGAQPGLILNAGISGNQLRVEVIRCQAITADGYVIEINEATSPPVQTSAAMTVGEIPVFLSVGAAEKMATGSPDSQEDIPRLPYRAFDYRLHLGERPGVSEGQLLQLALLEVTGTEVRPVSGYFPPCVSLYADEHLHQKVVDLRSRLETLLAIGNRAFASINAAGVSTDLYTALRNTIFEFVRYLSTSLDEFIPGVNAGHPLGMVIFFRRLFRFFNALLILNPGVKDYVHEKFFVKQTDSDISYFMRSIDDFLMAHYNHEDIGGHVRTVENILEQIKGLMAYLAQVEADQLGPQAVATDSISYAGRTYQLAKYSGTRMEQVGELIYLEVTLTEPRPMTDTVILLAKGLFSLQDWSSMQVRLGLNEARGLGETDPVESDAVTYGDKVALHPRDMLQSQSVKKLTMIFRGVHDARTFSRLGKMDLFVYTQ